MKLEEVAIIDKIDELLELFSSMPLDAFPNIPNKMKTKLRELNFEREVLRCSRTK